MDAFDRFSQCFQCLGAALFLLFSVFNFIRSLTEGSGAVIVICFAVMTALSFFLTRELFKEMTTDGGKR